MARVQCCAAPRTVDELLRAASSWTIARPARYGIETLSNVVCAAVVVVWLLTARPTNTFAPIAIVSLPTSVHVTPSGDEYALIRSEERRVGKECSSRWTPELDKEEYQLGIIQACYCRGYRGR